VYITPAQLSTGAGASLELAQLFELPLELWQLTLSGGDRSAYSAAEIDAADAGLAAVLDACERASGEVEAYLAQRGYELPLDAADFPVLGTWGRAIARYHVHLSRERASTELGRIERDYREARAALERVAAGQLSLGANDPLAPGNSDPDAEDTGPIRYTSKPRMFSRDSLDAL
jgi:phage gp36-like protein